MFTNNISNFFIHTNSQEFVIKLILKEIEVNLFFLNILLHVIT